MKQIVKPKCPHCGFIRRIELDIEAGKVDLPAGIQEFVNALNQNWQEKIKPLLEGRHEFESGNWLPMPPCPECSKPYEYNVVTQETRP